VRDLLVRDATDADLPAVGEVYDHEARHGIATFDAVGRAPGFWTAKLTDDDPFLVAELGGAVVGFAYASTYRPRPAYDRTREVSVYLGEAARGQGVGRTLYAVLLDRLRRSGAHTALAVIALPNDPSVRLHESFGFVHTGTLREVGWKFGAWIDTAFYQLLLDS
jgi:phosphinothricin acetyltransferase